MSKFFINRPIVAIVISILMVMIGVVAMMGLPTALFPNIVPPEIKVTATYPGADALTLEQSVATPIEQQMSGVDNLNYMYSINANNGVTSLTTNFDIKTDPNTGLHGGIEHRAAGSGGFLHTLVSFCNSRRRPYRCRLSRCTRTCP